MKEFDFHRLLIKEFEANGAAAFKYGKMGFMPIGHKNYFDLLLFHKNKWVPNPIAIEAKTNENFSAITTAMESQIQKKYLYKPFRCDEMGWSGELPCVALITLSGYEEGLVYRKNFKEASNFFVDRFAWRFSYRKFAIMYKYGGNFWVSYENKYIGLFNDAVIHPYKIEGGKTVYQGDFRGGVVDG